MSAKGPCLLCLQDCAALVPHDGQLPAECLLSVVRNPCMAQCAVETDSRCAPLQLLHPLQDGEWVYLHISASALRTVRFKYC